MRVRFVIAAAAASALVACAPPVPESGAPAKTTTFEDYADFSSYRVRRDGDLAGTVQPRQPVTVVPPSQVADPSALVNAGAQPTVTAPPTATALTASAPTAAPTATATATAPVDPTASNRGISNEQDFDAVSNRQSIESDAERLRQNREAYQVIEPTAVPSRAGSGGPNIVEYALSTRNPVGQKVYRRGLTSQRKYDRACFQYVSADHAQEAFLRAGGPQRDRMGVDPDGDGYACDWNPNVYR